MTATIRRGRPFRQADNEYRRQKRRAHRYENFGPLCGQGCHRETQTVKGVGGVQLAGFRDREIRIWLNTDSMVYKITTKTIKNAIYNNHVELPAGRVETGDKEYGIRLQGEYASVAELEYLPVAVRNGAVIRLRDLARIEDGFEDKRSSALYEVDPTIMIQVRKQRGATRTAFTLG